MLTRHYRVSFSVRFDHDIEAENADTARLVADDMAKHAWLPLIAGLLVGEPKIVCAWSIIEPLGEAEETETQAAG